MPVSITQQLGDSLSRGMPTKSPRTGCPGGGDDLGPKVGNTPSIAVVNA